MKADKYDRQVTLLCPTCGCADLEILQGVGETVELVRCPSCGRELTREELINENFETIEENLNEVKEAVKKDFAKEMQKNLKNAFKGNKHFKFR